MNLYVVIAALVRFNFGATLYLTPQQAEGRIHNFKENKIHEKGRKPYTVEKQVEFKRGEVIGIEGEVNKVVLSLIAPEGSEEAKIVKASKTALKDKTTGEGLSEEKKAAIAAAVAQLDPKDDALWLEDGSPKVSAVKTVLKANVTKADIDAAAPGVTRVTLAADPEKTSEENSSETENDENDSVEDGLSDDDETDDDFDDSEGGLKV